MKDPNGLVLSEAELIALQKEPACPIGFLEYVPPTRDLNFGQALEAMRSGKRVRRDADQAREYRINGLIQIRIGWWTSGQPIDFDDSLWYNCGIDAQSILAQDWSVCDE